MLMFLVGIVMLVLGYNYYGKFVERILEPDDRDTTAWIMWSCRIGKIC